MPVLIVADDLIWSTRLAALVRAAGAEPRVAGPAAGVGETGERCAIVDLTTRAGDPLATVASLAAGRVRVLCVGQHDDVAQRKAALAAGAWKVLAYRKLAEDGSRVIADLLAGREVGTR